jgi:hypothetical protein
VAEKAIQNDIPAGNETLPNTDLPFWSKLI